MTDILIRQVPEELYARLKQSAEVNHRDLNQEIIILLERSLFEEPSRLPDPLQGTFPIDDEWLRQAREERGE